MKISKKDKIKLIANIIKSTVVIAVSSAALAHANPYIIVVISIYVFA